MLCTLQLYSVVTGSSLCFVITHIMIYQKEVVAYMWWWTDIDRFTAPSCVIILKLGSQYNAKMLTQLFICKVYIKPPCIWCSYVLIATFASYCESAFRRYVAEPPPSVDTCMASYPVFQYPCHLASWPGNVIISFVYKKKPTAGLQHTSLQQACCRPVAVQAALAVV